jgi:N-acetylneuraminate lyase
MQNMIKGLIAAAFSPMHENGSLHVELIPQIVEYLLQRPIQGLYVCGSTGEGPLLSVEERKQVAAAYINAVKKQIPRLPKPTFTTIIFRSSAAMYSMSWSS